MDLRTRFKDWPHNRAMFPDRHVVVCEDDLCQQARIAQKLSELCGGQHRVQMSLVPGARAAASILSSHDIHLVILDHDMPHGNGSDLLGWMAEAGLLAVPVVTFSGLPPNNERMVSAAASLGFRSVRQFSKNEVVDGAADAFIRESLSL